MLTLLEIENFRGFKKLAMPKLARVNLITGQNNCGKTSLLEAIYFVLSPPEQIINSFPELFRSSIPQSNAKNFWPWLIFDQAKQSAAMLRIKVTDEQTRSIYFGFGVTQRASNDLNIVNVQGLKVWQSVVPTIQPQLDLPKVSVFSTRPSSPTDDAQEYIEAARKSGGEERIEELLRELDSRLKRVRAYQVDGTNVSLIYADIGLSDLIPATQLGQGFNRVLRIYSTLVASQSRVCLIDEVENGLHHSVLRDVWQGLAAVAEREDVQIFATTHSWECVVAAHEVFRKRKTYDFALHRLERIKGEVQAITYDRETLDAVDELEMEVR